jgi:hypothetical protein
MAVDFYAGLAQVNLKMHRLPQAEDAIRSGLSVNPREPELLRLQDRLRRLGAKAGTQAAR